MDTEAQDLTLCPTRAGAGLEGCGLRVKQNAHLSGLVHCSLMARVLFPHVTGKETEAQKGEEISLESSSSVLSPLVSSTSDLLKMRSCVWMCARIEEQGCGEGVCLAWGRRWR